MSYKSLFALLSVFMLGASLASAAAVIEVKHSPGAGQFATVHEALATAQAGDTVRVIDNSALFVETINVDLANITLEGLSTLTPRPIIVGDGSGVVDAAGPVVLAYTANATGLIVRNLEIDCNTGAAPDQVCLLGTMADGALIDNCVLDAKLETRVTGGGSRAFEGAKDITFNKCTILNGVNTVVYGQFVAGGTVAFHNCSITGGIDGSFVIQGGTVTVDQHSTLNSSTAANTAYTVCATGDVNLTFRDSVMKSGLTEVLASLIVMDGSGTGGKGTLTVDNCDIVGTYNSATDLGSSTGLRGLGGAMTAVTITDSIFTNLKRGVYIADSGLSGVIEDYCVFKNAPSVQNTIAGFTNGPHDITLANDNLAANHLYADAAAGDYRLWQDSKAATLNSTGTPAYAGSLGLHPTLVPVELSTFTAE